MSIISNQKPIISVEHVSFAYDQQLILDDVSFSIHRGDYVGLIGPNGGGKSTLLKILVGLLKPDQGSVTLFDQPLAEFKNWPKIGYVAQNIVRLHNHFPATVSEVVGMGLYGKKGFFRTLTLEDQAKITNVLKIVELTDFSNNLIAELSGGQQQRAYIARALVSDPEILFLDEPTAGIDVKTQENFYALLRELNHKHHLTLILVSHELELVANEADEFACVNQKLTYHGTPKEFMTSEYMNQLYGEGLKRITHHHH